MTQTTDLPREIETVSMAVVWEVVVAESVAEIALSVFGFLLNDLCSPVCGYHLDGK